MRIVEHDELPSNMEADLQLLRLSVGWMPRDFSRIRRARRLGYPAPDYFGLYAVEGERVLSTVRVLRLPYTFPDRHVETVSAILSVITRRDCRGRGLARELLNEVHARERKAGSRFSLLWTDQSITAHRLYEAMGYQDVYIPEFGTRRSSGRSTSGEAYELRKATEADMAKIERLHTIATQNRIGFTPRPHGLLRSLVRFGISKPDSFRLILKDGGPIGYLELQEAPSWVNVSEVVLAEDSDSTDLLTALERMSRGKWLSFWNTFVRDSRKVLEGRRYAVSNLGDNTLMAMALEKSGARNLTSALGTADPRFVCHLLDHY
jgi:GNAT superfamily N-acetyltransferase